MEGTMTGGIELIKFMLVLILHTSSGADLEMIPNYPDKKSCEIAQHVYESPKRGMYFGTTRGDCLPYYPENRNP